MDYYAGIDVSLKSSSIAVVNAHGEIVREAFGDDSRAGIVELVGPAEGERAAELVDAAIGRGTVDCAGPETFWATRTVLVALAPPAILSTGGGFKSTIGSPVARNSVP